MTRLSVVVPTRDRADTLFHTLRTLTNQDYRDFEIIVSDNASTDETRKVVNSFSDTRIRYINTGKRLSMSGNWEFALGYVQGDFVTYIGDDDGFTPGSLTKAMRLLEVSQLDALIWDKAEYCWPDHVDDSHKNWLYLRAGNHSIQPVRGRKKLSMVMRFREVYTRLPCLYNGIIRKSTIDKICQLSNNNTFFNSISPDVFSSIALGSIIDKYLFSTYPFSVNGASRHSNGTTFIRPQAAQADSPTAKFISEQTRTYDHRIKNGPSAAICVMGEYLMAMQYVPGLHLPAPRWDLYVKSLIRNAKGSLLPDQLLQSAAHTAKAVGLKIDVPCHLKSSAPPRCTTGIQTNYVGFNVPETMVNNIYDACQLVSNMLPPNIDLSTNPPFNRFVKGLKDYFIAEAKMLYRNL